MRGSLHKPKNKAAQQNLEKAQTRKAREGLDSSHSQAPPNHDNQQGDTNMERIFLPNMPSFDKAKRLKLKPIRGSLDTDKSQAKPKVSVQEGNTNMDAITPPNMLRFLEKEEALLTQLQSKMSEEISRLQVEEHVFLHTLKILSQKHASINKVNEDQQQTSSGDQDLIDALNEALMENGESVPSNEDNGEETSEE